MLIKIIPTGYDHPVWINPGHICYVCITPTKPTIVSIVMISDVYDAYFQVALSNTDIAKHYMEELINEINKDN